ncbi:hypothetical protein KEM48_008942 [Puccinia striiformis f. sp. tritici PST-130]|nr:hypothetical protein KEM48_008942 [Puccinia striiformis f. sp. tritici PST-130]
MVAQVPRLHRVNSSPGKDIRKNICEGSLEKLGQKEAASPVADNPPPPPFVDPLTTNKQLDGIIKNILANQEAKLGQKIFFNQSLREYRTILKIESRPVPTDQLNLPIPEVTGNVHLDKHLAKTLITNKPVNKKEKATKKEILPLDSPFGDSTISSFTTEPYFEDLEPTDNLSSPVLKKIARKPALPILLDSEEELDKIQ